MRLGAPDVRSDPSARLRRVEAFPLVEALLERRSRRFARGARLAPPLAHDSALEPQPLTLEEEALLAFAACGITGPTLGDLPFGAGADGEAGGGNVLMSRMGRTVPSGDASHTVAVVVVGDDGAWLLRRPQDFAPEVAARLADMARSHRWVDLYRAMRVRIAESRVRIPDDYPYTPPFNRWSANRPGTTVFLPVAELTGLYLNCLLAAFGDGMGSFVLDERNRYRPAGLAPFAKSRGGHLHDDPREGRVGMLGYVDDWMLEFAAIEQGAMLQNLSLMCEALGIGGFAHFAAYPGAWCEALGFRCESVPFSRSVGAGPVASRVLRWLGRDVAVSNPVGLERDGEVLIRPWSPPYFASVEAAVRAFVDAKFAPGSGLFRDGGAHSAWRDAPSVQRGVPPYDPRAVDATIACADYAYRRYGRIPPGTGPFRTVLAFQAHRLDTDFYRRFYAER